jgi:UDP-N-acetylmuramate dehydrogenase
MKKEEYVPLRGLTTMGVGGNARYLLTVENISDLNDASDVIEKSRLPYFILGGGSNIVFSDDGFLGVVLKIEIPGITFEEKGGKVFVRAGAGVAWDDLVAETVSHGAYGLENLSLIPGTVGASVVQNIGAYGIEVERFVYEVEVFDIREKIVKTFLRDACQFGYRESIFKKDSEKKFVVTQVTYVLDHNTLPSSTYESLQKKLHEKNILSPTPNDIRETVIEVRTERLPYDGGLGSAGSFFKNPVVTKHAYDVLAARFPGIPGFPNGDDMKIPAGWLIDNVCGFRGLKEGDVGTYDKQALVIVNYGGASAKDIKKFAEKIAACVKEKTGIELEREVEYVV